MRYLLSILLASLCVTGAKAQKKLVIIGSSTSACFNVNSVTECYVGRLRTYYNALVPYDTTIDGDLALGGTNCYNGMPSSYTSPYADPYRPITDRNITTAVDINRHADVVLVNYPTNGYNVLSIAEIMLCLRTIRDSANIKGVPCFITTTQPRTDAAFNSGLIKRKLADLKDSILLQFGSFAIDFWTGLINPADSSILYDSGDNVHMSAAGHNVLLQRVLAKNIFSAALLPATFLQFNTIYKNKANVVTWSTAKETDVAFYEIQRSSDGVHFSAIATVSAANSAGTNQYSYTDENFLAGQNYYKIIIADRDGKKQASPVMSVFVNTGKLSIVKAFARTSTEVLLQLQNAEPQNGEWELLNNMGMLIKKGAGKIESGNTLLVLNTPALSSGVYHIKLVTKQGALISSFIKN